jgi:hypothetical protein
MVRLFHSVRGSQSETDDKPFPFKAFAKARMGSGEEQRI